MQSWKIGVALLGRLLLVGIFVSSLAGKLIPEFSSVTQVMASAGVPAPGLMLTGAVIFLLFGSASLLLGYHARLGATLLLVFLALANLYFHDFWTRTDPQAQQAELIQFLKNTSMMGAMLLVIANGAGVASLDDRREPVTPSPAH